MANITGWGRGTWGEGAWNAPLAVEVTGVAGTTALGSETVVPQALVSVTGHQAVGNPDLAGAFHAEWFVPTDTGDPTVKVISYEASTEVFSDGSSLGTISSAGGTLDVAASNYENKLISADKPITLQNTDNESTGVPTSWAGTSFGFRNTRTGFILQIRALYGTTDVRIFKDGSLNATISAGSTATTTQTYADDTNDPEYTVFSDLPIIVFKTADASLETDTRPVFPATTDFLYGIASGSATAIRVDGHGETANSFTRFDSDGGSNSSTISTTNTNFAAGTDFTGPTNRYQTASSSSAFSIADSDGGEKTSFIPEGCFAHEFRLIEAAEFVCFMGAPGTNGRNIQVFNSSGNLIDTVQLATSNTGSDFPTKFQLISNSTTDSNLTGSAKSYDLTAGMRFVSEVPVGAIVEDDSADNEENLFGLRTFAGFMTGTATVAVTGVAGTSALGNEVSFTNVVVVETGLQGTTALGNVVSDGGAVAVATGLAGTSALGNTTETGTGIFSVTGVVGTSALGNGQAFPEFVVGAIGNAGTGAIGNSSISGTCSFSVTGVVGTSALGEEGTSAGSTVVETGLSATGSVGTITVLPSLTIPVTGSAGTGAIGDALGAGGAKVVEEGLTGTVNIGDEAVTGTANISVTGVSATGSVNQNASLTIFTITVVGGNPSNHPYHNVGSANKFAVNGSTATADVLLTLDEGRTYRFDQSDSSNSGHPLRFSTTANGTHGGGSEYTTGVTTNGTPGQAGAYTEITVAHGAPTLYYYCTNHSAMGWQANTDENFTTFTITVVGGNPSNHPNYNVGSANKYAVNGSTATADVVLDLIEGQRYRFDQSDSSNSGHPLRFTADAASQTSAASSSLTEYTTGVTTNGTPGQAGAYTEIVVASDAPTLYYYCTNHSAMGATLNTVVESAVVIIGTALFAVTGLSGTSALGTAVGVIPIVVSVTGSSATSALGTATSSVVSNIVITGVAGIGTLGTLNLYGIIANEVSVSYTEVTPSQNANYEAA